MSETGAPLPVLLGIGVFLSFGAAWLTGRAFGDTWRPVWQVFPPVALLTIVARFLNYALFQGDILSFSSAAWLFLVLLTIALTGYRLKLAAKMVAQYPWLYQRAGPFGWRDIKD